MKSRWKWAVLGPTAATLFVGIVAWWVWFPGQAFDPVAWQNEFEIREGVRLPMADRLVAQGTLRGKNRGEVVALLGEPYPYRLSDSDLVYWLAHGRGFGVWWLVLRLDQDSRVSNCRIVAASHPY